ncbi:unnamed protein product, partial [Meganyctiphanes norvegica]
MSILHFVYVILLVLVAACFQPSHVLAAAQFEDTASPSSYLNNSPCPNAEDIAPCVCTYWDVYHSLDIDCMSIEDEQQLYDVFHANIPDPNFRRLDLGTDNLKTLTDTVFGDVTFETVWTHSTGFYGILTSVGPETFMKSAPTLRELYMPYNNLSNFPFQSLSQYTELTDFVLHDNPVSNFPIIQSENLRYIDLGAATFDIIPTGALDGLPNLEEFDVSSTTSIHSMAA